MMSNKLVLTAMSPLALDMLEQHVHAVVKRNKHIMIVADISEYELHEVGGRMDYEQEATWSLRYHYGRYLYTRSFVVNGKEYDEVVKQFVVKTPEHDLAVKAFRKDVMEAEPGINYHWCSDHEEFPI